jgi:glycosyltransferase involved in cell wall biosynthesis
MDCLNECDDVIVVNDGSTDNTGGILNDIKGITIVEYAGNRGKGYALKKGFAKALDMGFAYAITLDADGQHYPCDITKFLETNRKEPGTLIVGSRDMEGKERSKGSKFANAFSNFWFFIQTVTTAFSMNGIYQTFFRKYSHYSFDIFLRDFLAFGNFLERNSFVFIFMLFSQINHNAECIAAFC